MPLFETNLSYCFVNNKYPPPLPESEAYDVIPNAGEEPISHLSEGSPKAIMNRSYSNINLSIPNMPSLLPCPGLIILISK